MIKNSIDIIEASLGQWMQEGPLGFSNLDSNPAAIEGLPPVDDFDLYANNMDGMIQENNVCENNYSANDECIIDSTFVMSPMSNPTSPDLQKLYSTKTSEMEEENIEVEVENEYCTELIDEIFGKNLEEGIDAFLENTNIVPDAKLEAKDLEELVSSIPSKEANQIVPSKVLQIKNESANEIDEFDRVYMEKFSVQKAQPILLNVPFTIGIEGTQQVFTLVQTQTPISSPKNPVPVPCEASSPKSCTVDDDDPEWLPMKHSPQGSVSTNKVQRKRKISEESEIGDGRSDCKRNQNKEAARRYRDKKKQEASHLEKKRQELEEIHSKLEKEFEKKFQERKIMIDLWKDLAKKNTNPNFTIRFPSWMALEDD